MHRYYILAKIYRSLINTEKNMYQMYRSLMKSDKNMYQMFIGLLTYFDVQITTYMKSQSFYVYPMGPLF